MAEKVIINKSILTDISNAIREKKGTTDLIPTTEMASEIAEIQSGGGGVDTPKLKNLSVKYGKKYTLTNINVASISIKEVEMKNMSYNAQ